MDNNPRIEQQIPQEKQTRLQKAGKFIARIGLAAACIIPTADLALSDAAFAKVYEVTQDKVSLSSKAAEHAAESGIVGAVIGVESMALGAILTKNKKLKGVFKDFDEYLDVKHATMSKPRRAVSKVVNAPYKMVEKVAGVVEKAGEKVADRKSWVARATGKLLIDAGATNAIGTSGVIMQETMAGDPPSLARNARLAGIITGSWLGEVTHYSGVTCNGHYSTRDNTWFWF